MIKIIITAFVVLALVDTATQMTDGESVVNWWYVWGILIIVGGLLIAKKLKDKKEKDEK